jgi:hypothetical protein
LKELFALFNFDISICLFQILVLYIFAVIFQTQNRLRSNANAPRTLFILAKLSLASQCRTEPYTNFKVIISNKQEGLPSKNQDGKQTRSMIVNCPQCLIISIAVNLRDAGYVRVKEI